MINEKVSFEKLINRALDIRKMSYAPYSNYTVGAALLTESGKVYTGCNIENASYGVTNCAERTAFFKAISEGERKFSAIAIAGGIVEQAPVEYAYPCGVCRQVMQEFTNRNFNVIVAKSHTDYKVYRLDELLPFSFGGESIR